MPNKKNVNQPLKKTFDLADLGKAATKDLKPSASAARVRAALGIDGRIDTACMSDKDSVDYAVRELKEKMTTFAATRSGNLMQVEVVDDVGITPLETPFVRIRAILDRSVKSALKRSMIFAPNVTILRDCELYGRQTCVLTTCRMLVWIEPDQFAQFEQESGRLQIVRNGLGVPALRARLLDDKKAIENAVDWMFAVKASPYVVRPAGESALLKRDGEMKPSEMLRIAETLSQLEIATALTGTGALKGVVQGIRTKTTAYQKSRPDGGLQDAPDIWADWVRLRQENGKTRCLPLRMDLQSKVKSSKAAPKRSGRKNGPPANKPLPGYAVRMRARKGLAKAAPAEDA